MWRFTFSLSVLCALFVLVPFISRVSPSATATAADVEDGLGDLLDVDTLRSHSRNRPLRLASDVELSGLRRATVADLLEDLAFGSERERRLAGSLLGISGHPAAIEALIAAFEREKEPRALAALAMALAETRTNAAIEALVRAIRERPGLVAYESCRALGKVYGRNLGLDAGAWERWLTNTEATRD